MSATTEWKIKASMMNVRTTLLRASSKMTLLAFLALNAIATEPVWAGANDWARLGPDGGQIWALSVDPHHPGTIYAAFGDGEGHAFKSSNGGDNWTASAAPNSTLIFDPRTPGTIYAVVSYRPALARGIILKSTDDGTSWSTANSGLPNSYVSSLAIDSVNSSTLYAGTGSGVFKSTDGGMSWGAVSSQRWISPAGDTLSQDQDRHVQVYALLTDPLRMDTIYAVVDHPNAPGAWLFKSTDGGGNWNPPVWDCLKAPSF